MHPPDSMMFKNFMAEDVGQIEGIWTNEWNTRMRIENQLHTNIQ